MTFDIIHVTREALINTIVQSLLVNDSKKLPTKTQLANKMDLNFRRLKLSQVTILDLILQQLNDFEKEVLEILNLVKQKSNDLTTADKIDLFFKQVIALVIKNKNLSHLLSNNNLYGLQEVVMFNREFHTKIYLNIRNILLSEVKSYKLNTTIAQLLVDTLDGLFLTLSNNIEMSEDIQADYLVQVSLINNLLKPK